MRGAHIVLSKAYVDREGTDSEGNEWGSIEVDQQIINNEGKPLLDYYYDKKTKQIKKYDTADNKKHQIKNNGIPVPGISFEKRAETLAEYNARKEHILSNLSEREKNALKAIKGGNQTRNKNRRTRNKNRRTRSKK